MVQTAERARALAVAYRLETLTVTWMLAEAALAIRSGIAARSGLLTAIGADSVLELLSGAVLLWRLGAEIHSRPAAGLDRIEPRAAWIAAALLVLLCGCVAMLSATGLWLRVRPEGSGLGLAVAAVALVGMPVLARYKSRANRVIQCSALRADIAESSSCAFLAAAALAGVGLSTLLGWWWADYVGAILLLVWLIPEAREAVEGAREGRLRCDCG